MVTKQTTKIDPFGELIKQARIDKGLTQAELGAACGVSQAAAGAWESGSGKPTVKNLHLIATALDLPVELLREKLLESASSKLSGNAAPRSATPIANKVLETPPQYFERMRNIIESEGEKTDVLDNVLEFALENIEGLKKDIVSQHATGLKWTVPVQTDHYAIDLHFGNRFSDIVSAAFHLATFRAACADKRDYFLVVVSPEGEDEKSNYIQDRNLKMLELEASFLGVTIERVEGGERAKTLIKTIDDWQRHIKNNS